MEKKKTKQIKKAKKKISKKENEMIEACKELGIDSFDNMYDENMTPDGMITIPPKTNPIVDCFSQTIRKIKRDGGFNEITLTLNNKRITEIKEAEQAFLMFMMGP